MNRKESVEECGESAAPSANTSTKCISPARIGRQIKTRTNSRTASEGCAAKSYSRPKISSKSKGRKSTTKSRRQGACKPRSSTRNARKGKQSRQARPYRKITSRKCGPQKSTRRASKSRGAKRAMKRKYRPATKSQSCGPPRKKAQRGKQCPSQKRVKASRKAGKSKRLGGCLSASARPKRNRRAMRSDVKQKVKKTIRRRSKNNNKCSPWPGRRSRRAGRASMTCQLSTDAHTPSLCCPPVKEKEHRKRPPGVFVFYYLDMYKQLSQGNLNNSKRPMIQIVKQASRSWHMLSKETKEIYGKRYSDEFNAIRNGQTGIKDISGQMSDNERPDETICADPAQLINTFQQPETFN